MSVAEPQVRETGEARDRVGLTGTLLPPILFSLFYFVSIYFRATQKYFWFDELVTRDICRVPLGSLWALLRHGADFNPPLFFVITKLSVASFGETLIGLRAPEILGFWILCLSLYRIVNRRVGWLAASIAMVLPIVTGAFYYAYEARPHAIVLGFCGLAFVFWQLTLEKPESRKWLVAFSFCLLAAFLLHCYAILISVPFALCEVVRIVRYHRIRWGIWIAMFVPSFVAAFVYVPLLVSYRKQMTGTDYATLFPPSVGALTAFYVYLLAPCLFVVIAACAVFAVENIRGARLGRSSEQTASDLHFPETIVSATFLVLPILGLILARIIHGPFFGRYFLSMVIGLGVLIGLAAGIRGSMNWVAVSLAAILCFPVLWGFGALASHRYHGKAEELHEPSSNYDMNSSLAGPLERYELLISRVSEPGAIAVLDPLDFLYLLHYAPDLRPRLYYVQDSPHDFAFIGFRNYHAWAPFQFNRELTRVELLQRWPHSLVYGKTSSVKGFAALVATGGTITSLQFANDHFLADLHSDLPRLH